MRKSLITILLLITLCTLLFTSCVTTASWVNQNTDTDTADVNVTKVNGSEKYIVFVALDSSGNCIVKNTATTAVAYAVIGYTQLVAELVIPSRYTDTSIYTAPSGTDHSLPVTQVRLEPNYANYKCSVNGAAYTGDDPRLNGNTIIKSIVFGSNVTRVKSGVCVGLLNLTSVRFDTTSAVTLEEAAFAACPDIEAVSFAGTSGSVTLNGNFVGITPTYAS